MYTLSTTTSDSQKKEAPKASKSDQELVGTV
jgi:hypothetical protein